MEDVDVDVALRRLSFSCAETEERAESSWDFCVIALSRDSRPSFSWRAEDRRSRRRRISPSPRGLEPQEVGLVAEDEEERDLRPWSKAAIKPPDLTRANFAFADASCCFWAVEAWSRDVRCRRAL